VLRFDLLAGCALAATLIAGSAHAQDLQSRPVAPPSSSDPALSAPAAKPNDS
jgi:LPS-assembly protein